MVAVMTSSSDAPRMLIVDGHPTVRRVMARIFSMDDWDVRSAAGVAEALRELERSPDCVVLELDLPDGQGERVLEAVQSSGAAMDVLVVTADDDRERLAAVRAQFQTAGIFVKPGAPADLFLACDAIRARTKKGRRTISDNTKV